MKQFNNAKITLFDSVNAQFKLTVEGIFTKKTPAGTFQPLVYITQQGNAVLNSNIYLVFTYKLDGADRNPAIYMSYPQLYGLRKILGDIKNLIETDGFITTPDGIAVNPKYTEPLIFDNIGKGNKWMAFKLVSIEDTEEGIKKVVPAVSIELSDNNGGASVLTTTEIMTIYSIVQTLDLASIQTQLNIAYLMGQDSQPIYQTTTNYVPQAPTYQPYQQPYQPQQPVYGGYNGNYGRPQTAQPSQPYQQTGYRTVPKTGRIPTNPAGAPVYNTPVSSQEPVAQSQPQQKRTESSVLNLKSVEGAPQTDFIYPDDEDAINAIFNND